MSLSDRERPEGFHPITSSAVRSRIGFLSVL